jgi:hypothetical protein
MDINAHERGATNGYSLHSGRDLRRAVLRNSEASAPGLSLQYRLLNLVREDREVTVEAVK